MLDRNGNEITHGARVRDHSRNPQMATQYGRVDVDGNVLWIQYDNDKSYISRITCSADFAKEWIEVIDE